MPSIAMNASTLFAAILLAALVVLEAQVDAYISAFDRQLGAPNKLSRQQRQIASAYLAQEVAKVRELEDLLEKRFDDDEGGEQPQQQQLAMGEMQSQTLSMLRAGRKAEAESAPTMYARHISELGGTMFRFG